MEKNKTPKRTQVDDLVEWCERTRRPIEGYIARMELGIAHLPGVVRDAKEKGHNFVSTRKEIIARNGRGTFYTEYRLLLPEEQQELKF